KITTYRKLSDAVMEKLRPSFPQMTASWTGTKPLPGGNIPNANFESFIAALTRDYPHVPASTLRTIARRQGSLTRRTLGHGEHAEDLGTHFGDTLFAREVDHLVDNEFARTGDDVLRRRTKCGLHMSDDQRNAVGEYVK